ncbi:hypothetical protein ACRRTK_004724 [Alexandromys fortis]
MPCTSMLHELLSSLKCSAEQSTQVWSLCQGCTLSGVHTGVVPLSGLHTQQWSAHGCVPALSTVLLKGKEKTRRAAQCRPEDTLQVSLCLLPRSNQTPGDGADDNPRP